MWKLIALVTFVSLFMSRYVRDISCKSIPSYPSLAWFAVALHKLTILLIPSPNPGMNLSSLVDVGIIIVFNPFIDALLSIVLTDCIPPKSIFAPSTNSTL